MARLDGKTAVITGGNSGIGLETARAFVKEGARVIVFGRNQQSLDAAVRELGDKAIGVRGDVSKQADLDELFSVAKEQFGKLDILFVNAGIAKPSAIGETTEEFFDETFGINVKGAYFTIQTALPLLRELLSFGLGEAAVLEKLVERFPELRSLVESGKQEPRRENSSRV